MKINPTRKDITEKLSLYVINGGRKKYIYLAGFLIIVLGGVCSWYLNTGEEEAPKLDLVGRARRLFSLEKHQKAKKILVEVLNTEDDEDMLAEARYLLDKIDRDLKRAEQAWADSVKSSYNFNANLLHQHLREGRYFEAVSGLGKLAEDFEGATYRIATQNKTKAILMTLRNKLVVLRNSLVDLEVPDMDEEVEDVYNKYKGLISTEEKDALKATADMMDTLSKRDIFADVIKREFVSSTQEAVYAVERYLEKISILERRLKAFVVRADLSVILEKADDAMRDGRLEDALEYYRILVLKCGNGPLTEDFKKTFNMLEDFFFQVENAQNLARTGKVNEGYDLAMELLGSYLDEDFLPDKVPDRDFTRRVKIPILLISEPENARVSYKGKETKTPHLLFIGEYQNLTVKLDYEGYTQFTCVISKEDGAVQSFTLNRETLFTQDLGSGYFVEGRPKKDLPPHQAQNPTM